MAMRPLLPCGCAQIHAYYDIRRDVMVCWNCGARADRIDTERKEKQMFGVGSIAPNALALAQQNNQSLQNPYLGMGVLGGFTSSEMSRDYAEVERLRKLAEEEQQLLCLLTQGD